MDLAEVRLSGIAAHQVEVLDGHATVGVAFHAFAGDKADRGLRLFREAVCDAAGDGFDESAHGCSVRVWVVAAL